jgi:hypothetical protein
MSDHSREQAVILTAIWWWQKLWTGSKECRFIWRCSISNRFAALENLDAGVDINRTWETIRERIPTF